MKSAILFGFVFFSIPVFAQQEIELIKLDKLNQLIEQKSDNLKVINFWASWCGPCVKEMPYFDFIDKNENVEVYLVSLDFPQDKLKAEKLLNKKGIQSTTYLLDEKNYDKYIESIYAEWSGAIPATLFIDSTGKKSFYEKAFEKHELEEIVNKLTTK